MSLRDGETKSVAGLTTGTAGLTRGTVKPLAQENYLPRSHEKDRDLSLDASSGLTTGTHIIYHVGCGVEATRDDRCSQGQPIWRTSLCLVTVGTRPLRADPSWTWRGSFYVVPAILPKNREFK